MSENRSSLLIKIIMALLLVMAISNCVPISTSTPKASAVISEEFTDIPVSSTTEIHPTQTRTPIPSQLPVLVSPDPNAASIYTPVGPADCPPTINNDHFALPIPSDSGEPRIQFVILEALNNGIPFDTIDEALREDIHYWSSVESIDLTGDGIAEVLVTDLIYRVFILGCDQGAYRIFLNYEDIMSSSMTPPRIFAFEDMNLNGTPEILWTFQVGTGGTQVIDVHEWNGHSFTRIIINTPGGHIIQDSNLWRALWWYFPYSGYDGPPGMEGPAEVIVRDLDMNGTKEIIAIDQGPIDRYKFICNPPRTEPWRVMEKIYTWDGHYYSLSSVEMELPIYRFQAIQDADRLFLLGEYDRALALYQDVVFSNTLEWWSPERMTYVAQEHCLQYERSNSPIVEPEHFQNPSEYLSLAAYARYRIMLHHVVRGWLPEAELVYETLVSNFPPASTGYTYVEISSVFWENYQSSRDSAFACKAAIEFVESNPSTLFYLGRPDHGHQSHRYTPQDLCPLK